MPRNKEKYSEVDQDSLYFVQDDMFGTPKYFFDVPMAATDMHSFEVDNHLLDLSFLAVTGFSVNFDFTVTIPQKRYFMMLS
jgi:hypothetical protein